MTEQEFLNSDILKIPITRKVDDFSNFTTYFLQTYLAMLKSVEGDFKNKIYERIQVIQELSNNLINSIEFYYLGNVSKAYQSFCYSLSLIKKYLWMDNTGVTVFYDEKTENLLREDFFKARIVGGNFCSKKEMFIRPFEQREYINTYRYSIPGFPCLYLSSNIYTAWNELNCPDINTLQVSRFILDKTLKRLRFGFNINFWRHSTQNSENVYSDKLYDYLTYFPLHAMCNIRVKNHLAVFKPEYIFPQFLMQWIKDEHHIDMVEYASTKINFDQNKLSPLSYNYRNLAIPAQSFQEKGPCTQLQSKIKLTQPISWQQLQSMYPKRDIPIKPDNNVNAFRMMRNMIQLELIRGKPMCYENTIFGLMENFIIDEMDLSFL